MHSKWTWLAAQFSRTLWVRASLFCVLAVVTALVGMGLDPFIPGDLSGVIGADAVDHILDILASSMLAVTTFSLTVMVSAYAVATSNVTPRAIRLLMQDTTTQNVLSTFLGSFLFSLVGIIALSAGAYGESGRVVLFVVTLGVIGLVVVTMLRWISHLSHFGRVADTTDRVEAATQRALQDRVARPFLGGRPLDINAGLDCAFPVLAQRSACRCRTPGNMCSRLRRPCRYSGLAGIFCVSGHGACARSRAGRSAYPCCRCVHRG
jgi:uncharacterized membrane protein